MATFPPSRFIKTQDKARMGGEFAKLRGLAMLKEKITKGISDRKVAKAFNVSLSTVQRSLQMVVNKGLLETYQDQLLAFLVPGAMRAVKKALEDGDAQVALEILKGSGILTKTRDANHVNPANEGESLEAYIRIRKATPDGTRPSLPANGEGNVPLSLVGEVGPTDPEVDAEGLREVDDINRLPPVPAIEEFPLACQEGELVGSTVDEDLA